MSETTTPDTPATRLHEGVELPTPGTFKLDPAHSHVGFVVRHMMIAKVRGRFSEFEGTLTIADDPLQSTLSVAVQLASIDTRDPDRDGHLRSADFFDVETYPTMTFTSQHLEGLGGDRFRVDGELTLHGVTRPLSLEATIDGIGVDPWANERVGFAASGELDREEFGLTWNQPLAGGGVLVAKQVRLELEAEFVRQ